MLYPLDHACSQIKLIRINLEVNFHLLCLSNSQLYQTHFPWWIVVQKSESPLFFHHPFCPRTVLNPVTLCGNALQLISFLLSFLDPVRQHSVGLFSFSFLFCGHSSSELNLPAPALNFTSCVASYIGGQKMAAAEGRRREDNDSIFLQREMRSFFKDVISFQIQKVVRLPFMSFYHPRSWKEQEVVASWDDSET